MGWPDKLPYVYDSNGVVIGLATNNGTITFTGISTWGSLPAATDNLYRQFLVPELNNAIFYSDGAYWRPVNGVALIKKIATEVSIIFPAATFVTLTQADNGSGKTRLASAGVHGLTTGATHAGVNVYVTWSGGTGVTGMYSILTISDTTHIDIDLAYSPVLGTAVVTVLGATNYANVITTVIPANSMGLNGSIDHDYTIVCGGTAGTREVRTIFGTTLLYNQGGPTTTSIKMRAVNGVVNIGSASVQGQKSADFGFGYGQTTTSYRTGAENTTLDTNLILQISNTVANEVVSIKSYELTLRV